MLFTLRGHPQTWRAQQPGRLAAVHMDGINQGWKGADLTLKLYLDR